MEETTHLVTVDAMAEQGCMPLTETPQNPYKEFMQTLLAFCRASYTFSMNLC